MRLGLGALSRRLPQGGLARAVTVLAGGAALGQIIVIAASPILTRLYSPEEFGVLGLYMAFVLILATIATGRYELAIPLPAARRDAADVLWLSLAVLALSTTLLGVVFLLYPTAIADMLQVASVRPYLWMAPIGVLAVGAYQTFNYWATRHKDFGLLGATRVAQSGSMVLLQLGMGAAGVGAVGLVAGYLLSRFVGIGALWRRAGLAGAGATWGGARRMAALYRNFPIYTAWAGLLNMLSLQLPAVLLVRYFTLEAAGFFTHTVRVLGLPAALLGQALAQALYPSLADRMADGKDCRALLERITGLLLLVSFGMFAFVALHGDLLFALVFGASWREAGRYAQLLAPWFLFSLVASPVSSFVLVRGRQRQAFFVTLYELILRVAALGAGAWYDNPRMSVGLYGAAGALIGAVYILWVLRLAGTPFASLWRGLRRPVLLAALLLGGLAVAVQNLPGWAAIPLSAAALGLFCLYEIRRLPSGEPPADRA